MIWRDLLAVRDRALRDAIAFIDRLMPQSPQSGEGWTSAEVLRLAEIRRIALNP